jgi:hypothetical protein
MNELLSVTFDGSVLTPDQPLQLERNKRYLITIVPEQVVPVQNAWDLLGNLMGTVEAPEDWSAEHDHYLYGTPKIC